MTPETRFVQTCSIQSIVDTRVSYLYIIVVVLLFYMFIILLLSIDRGFGNVMFCKNVFISCTWLRFCISCSVVSNLCVKTLAKYLKRLTFSKPAFSTREAWPYLCLSDLVCSLYLVFPLPFPATCDSFSISVTAARSISAVPASIITSTA